MAHWRRERCCLCESGNATTKYWARKSIPQFPVQRSIPCKQKRYYQSLSQLNKRVSWKTENDGVFWNAQNASISLRFLGTQNKVGKFGAEPTQLSWSSCAPCLPLPDNPVSGSGVQAVHTLFPEKEVSSAVLQGLWQRTGEDALWFLWHSSNFLMPNMQSKWGFVQMSDLKGPWFYFFYN